MDERRVVADYAVSQEAGSNAELAVEMAFIDDAVALTGLDEVFVDTPGCQRAGGSDRLPRSPPLHRLLPLSSVAAGV